VWPLLLILLGFAGWFAASGSPRSRLTTAARTAVLLALGWVTVGYAAYEWRAVRGRWWGSVSRAATRRIDPAIRWTLANTAPGDVIASEDEGALYLYTGRQSVPILSFTTAHYLRERTGAQEAAEGLLPVLAAYPVRVVLVGTDAALATARTLTMPPAPRLALRDQFRGGVAFTVLPQ
jgi:hypothetical protein